MVRIEKLDVAHETSIVMLQFHEQTKQNMSLLPHLLTISIIPEFSSRFSLLYSVPYFENFRSAQSRKKEKNLLNNELLTNLSYKIKRLPYKRETVMRLNFYNFYP